MANAALPDGWLAKCVRLEARERRLRDEIAAMQAERSVLISVAFGDWHYRLIKARSFLRLPPTRLERRVEQASADIDSMLSELRQTGRLRQRCEVELMRSIDDTARRYDPLAHGVWVRFNNQVAIAFSYS